MSIKDIIFGWQIGSQIMNLQMTKKNIDIPIESIVSMYLYGTPAKVTYNGVELPDIEAVWDKEKYPYAIISCTLDGSSCGVTFMSVPITSGEMTDVISYYVVDGGYGDAEEFTTLPALVHNWILIGDVNCIWTSHDIPSGAYDTAGDGGFTPDGSVYLAASEPVHSGNIGLRNGESVTYYEGAVLPKLPNTDLPYSLIHKSELANDYYFIASEKAGEVYNTFSSILDPRIEIGSEYTTHRWKSWKLSEGTTEWAEYRNSDNWYYNNFKADTLVWTNFDMYYMDSTTVKEEQRGTLYVNASSDPVPVSGVVVGYSYNGTVLPELPEWDKTVYPYASIWNLGIYNYLWISSQPQYIAAASNGNDAIHSLTPNIGYCYEIDRSEDGWLRLSDDNYGGGQYLKYYDFVWCNAPIEKDGTVVYERTDPIPVYE